MTLARNVDNFFTEFTTVKRAVIRSRALKIPEIIVTFTMVVSILGVQIVYKLNFLSMVLGKPNMGHHGAGRLINKYLKSEHFKNIENVI